MSEIHSALLYFICIVMSLAIHEFGHAWVAYRLGDSTARSLGRVTINPINHLDPMGTLMLAILAFSQIGIGWAKPVPVNPMNLSDPRRDLMLISFAGPLMNLIQAFVVSGVLVALLNFGVLHPQANQGGLGLLKDGLYIYMVVNIGLFLFNMLPIYPLDGSKIISFFMPRPIAFKFESKMFEWGSKPFIILFIAQMLLGHNGPFSLILGPAVQFLFGLLLSFWSIVLSIF